MGFGGSVSGMLTSLKNNKRERKSALKKLKDNSAEYGSTKLHFEKKASAHQLKMIRKKLKEENRKTMQKRIIILLVLLGVIIYFIGFAKF